MRWFWRVVLFPFLPLMLWYRLSTNRTKALADRQLWEAEALSLADVNSLAKGVSPQHAALKEVESVGIGGEVIGNNAIAFGSLAFGAQHSAFFDSSLGKPYEGELEPRWMGKLPREMNDGHLYNTTEGIKRGTWRDGRNVGYVEPALRNTLFAERRRRAWSNSDISKF